MRFAILQKYNKEGQEKIVLERDEDTVISLIKAAVISDLTRNKKLFRNFTQAQVLTAVESAIRTVINEFKKESVKL
jgi:hypothetical protein